MTRASWRLLIGGLITAGLLIAGVASFRILVGPKHRTWTEDVLLDDGSTIVVERSVTFSESNSWSGDAYNATESSSTIAFTGNLQNLPSWNLPLMPLVLYRDTAAQAQWVVVASTTTCGVWNARGEPRPPYWEFRLGNAGWQEVPLSATSLGRSTNLYLGYNVLKAKHVTVAMRRTSNGEAVGEYRFVLANATWNCGTTKWPPATSATSQSSIRKE